MAEIAHHPMLEPVNGSRLGGRATLRLRANALHVRVSAARPVHIELRRCQGGGGNLLLVVTACGTGHRPCMTDARFDLPMYDRLAACPAQDIAQVPASHLRALGHDALHGLPTRGWLAAPPAGRERRSPPPRESDRAYFLHRVRDEIKAALRAREPAVASRHVQLATLLVRRL